MSEFSLNAFSAFQHKFEKELLILCVWLSVRKNGEKRGGEISDPSEACALSCILSGHFPLYFTQSVLFLFLLSSDIV